MPESRYLQPNCAAFAGRRGFRVLDADSGWLLSEHAQEGEAEWRCDAANEAPRTNFVVTDSTGKVLYGRER